MTWPYIVPDPKDPAVRKAQIEQDIRNRIWINIHQRYWKYKSGRWSTDRMRKYLIRHTFLNWFQVNDLMKEMKRTKGDFWRMLHSFRKANGFDDEAIMDTDNPDYDSVRRKNGLEK